VGFKNPRNILSAEDTALKTSSPWKTARKKIYKNFAIKILAPAVFL